MDVEHDLVFALAVPHLAACAARVGEDGVPVPGDAATVLVVEAYEVVI
jgi:hypothetical protein